jgi:hypothetical protein
MFYTYEYLDDAETLKVCHETLGEALVFVAAKFRRTKAGVFTALPFRTDVTTTGEIEQMRLDANYANKWWQQFWPAADGKTCRRTYLIQNEQTQAIAEAERFYEGNIDILEVSSNA